MVVLRPRIGVVVALATLVLTGCGTVANRPASSSKTVTVVYAGSLAYINDRVIGPEFQHHTGIRYLGRGGGSFAMAQQLAAGLIPGQVFESVGVAPIQRLEPKQTTWAVRVAATPLVIAYNPHSVDGPYFKKVAQGRVSLKAFFEFLRAHPVTIGRTNPETDPQGQAFYEMVELAVRRYGLPQDTVRKILGAWNNSRQIYSEEGLPAEMQAGGLELSSAFLPEAIQYHLSYIALPAFLNFSRARDAAWYAKASVPLPSGPVSGRVLAIWATVLNRANVGTQYVRYLLSHETQLKQFGYAPLPATIAGHASQVPAAIRHA